MSAATVLTARMAVLALLFSGTMIINQAFSTNIMQPKHYIPLSALNMVATDQVPIPAQRMPRFQVKAYSSAAAVLSTLLISRSARAGLFTSEEQDQIERIGSFQRPIFELLDQLRPSVVPNTVGVYAQTQVLKGGKEDSDVVLNYLETYIKPCQSKMLEAAPKLKLVNAADQTRIELLPQLMMGHILELNQAIKDMKADSQAREVEEVTETLAEYLKLASSKYVVNVYVAPRALTEKEYLGPLGCEFWGKKRIEGSNACANIPENETAK